MTIEDFYGACEVSDATELENSLNRRYSQEANSFWLTHAPSKSPSLAILVKHSRYWLRVTLLASTIFQVAIVQDSDQ